jgi:RNA-dependent RNA polymerase
MRQNPGEPPFAVEGNVLLVRAPTVDVGDVQFARAVGNPPPGAERFHYLPNVVIFSTQGATPLLTQLSRGDMDGDLVGVIYDERLFPMTTEPAMQHQPKTPVDLPHDCTINEVIDFVLRFFRNDILGMIASRVSE